MGDKEALVERAKQLNLGLTLIDYQEGQPYTALPGHLRVLSIPCPSPVISGQLDAKNAPYVLEMLRTAAARCMKGEFSALVTAPVHKGIMNQAGYAFTGHTEFFAEYFQAPQVVMMLACKEMKVALVTTHLSLRKVPDAINEPLIKEVITQLYLSLQQDFGISHPKIYVAGLNPHAGEGGYLGQEEIKVITPALMKLKQQGIDVEGPFPADTMFSSEHAKACDAFVAMYHDQGLAVLKYASFGRAVNVTLGLPIVRTSVDHGTALDLAGKGLAHSGSLLAAVRMAARIAKNRESLT
jgi:4-hydroxythreonine-4-phosphate dehydrogenase